MRDKLIVVREPAPEKSILFVNFLSKISLYILKVSADIKFKHLPSRVKIEFGPRSYLELGQWFCLTML